jgi:hypothetical protein
VKSGTGNFKKSKKNKKALRATRRAMRCSMISLALTSLVSIGPPSAAVIADLATVLVHLVQPGVISRAGTSMQTMQLPMVHTHEVGIAYQGRSSELTFRTEQLGTVALLMSDELPDELERKIAMLRSRRAQRRDGSTH